ncbi:MAG: fasciclin domain-containing protein [Marinifilaceae bacterium]|jgi:hypothetical protein|nr:fasciclin domain-containing protein [Marinifilaceae bacterium]
MKHFKYIIPLFIILISCQEKNFIDTGNVTGIVDKTMLDYMKSDSYNWDSTILVIKRANLESLFEGTDPDYPQITFFGPTNLSILRYMLPKGYKKVDDIPENECKDLILRHVLEGRLMKEDVPDGVGNPKQGGKNYTSLGGNEIWLYKKKDGFGPFDVEGPTHLYLESIDFMKPWDIASANIQTNTGIVHSMEYAYVFGEI